MHHGWCQDEADESEEGVPGHPGRSTRSLVWLKNNHPLYFDIDIDEERLSLLPDNGSILEASQSEIRLSQDAPQVRSEALQAKSTLGSTRGRAEEATNKPIEIRGK